MSSTLVPERLDMSKQRHALQLAEACHDEMVFDPFVTLYQKSGEVNPAHLVGPQPFLYYERKALERHARREDRPSLEDSGVVRATSRIATISMKEMRRCFQEIRNLPEADVNPDHVLANGMTMGSFCIEYLYGPAKPKPSRGKRAATGATPSARDPKPTAPADQQSERDHERIRGMMQNQRRVKQRLMTSYVDKTNLPERLGPK